MAVPVISNAKQVKSDNPLRNRANEKDRPLFPKNCRSGINNKQCKDNGCNFIFLPFDNYGCCTNCGAEVLT